MNIQEILLIFPKKIPSTGVLDTDNEAIARRYSVKKVFLEISEISKNSQENTCARVLFLCQVGGLVI